MKRIARRMIALISRLKPTPEQVENIRFPCC